MAASEGPGWRTAWAVGCALGEGPIWDARTAKLRFVDIERRHLHWFDPADGSRGSWTAPCRVGSIGVRAHGGFIAGTDLGFAVIDPETDRFEVIDQPEPYLPDNRFNDGKVDPRGNFWAGTMDDHKRARSGALYCLRPDGTWRVADPGYRITNGPTFSADGRTLYHSDSVDGVTYAFDLSADGELSHRRIFRDWADVAGHPDGMTTDAAGYLWIAFWGAWCLRRIAPDGSIVAEHPLPVANVTCPVFAGAHLDRLFVTSASVDLLPGPAQPLAGDLFEVLGPGVAGLPGGVFGG